MTEPLEELQAKYQKALKSAQKALEVKQVNNQGRAKMFTEEIFVKGLSNMKDSESLDHDNQAERVRLVIEALEMAYDPVNEKHVGRNPRYLANALLKASCNKDFGLKEDHQNLRRTAGFEEPPVEYAQLLSQLRNDLLPPRTNEGQIREDILPPKRLKLDTSIEKALATAIISGRKYFAAIKKIEPIHEKISGIVKSDLRMLQKEIQSSLAIIVKMLEWTSADINTIYDFITSAFEGYGESPAETIAGTEWLCMELVHAMLNHKSEKDRAAAAIEQARREIHKTTLKACG